MLELIEWIEKTFALFCLGVVAYTVLGTLVTLVMERFWKPRNRKR